MKMNESTIQLIGFLALAINLYGMSSKGEYRLRIFSLLANSIYLVYGVLILAYPIIIGCCIAILLHTYHINRIRIHTDEER